MVNYRHGDLALISIDKLPEGSKQSKTDIIMEGSHGNNHTFKGGKLYLEKKGNFIIGYLDAGKDCTLFHAEHGKEIKGRKLREAKIKKGNPIPGRQIGYYMDVVAIKTKMQTIIWKDVGTHARFLGMMDNATKEVDVPDNHLKENEQEFSSFKELSAEIKKRDYDNINDLSAIITEEDYYYFLEALPPLKRGNGWFILSEALSDNLYYKFKRTKEGYLCEVVELEDEEVIELETAR